MFEFERDHYIKQHIEKLGKKPNIIGMYWKDANSLYFAVPSKPFVDSALHSRLPSVSAPQPLIFDGVGFY